MLVDLKLKLQLLYRWANPVYNNKKRTLVVPKTVFMIKTQYVQLQPFTNTMKVDHSMQTLSICDGSLRR